MFVRISDNVLDKSYWTVAELVIKNHRVTGMTITYQGSYDLPSMVGWCIGQVVEWQNYDATGNHPENYHEVSKCGEKRECFLKGGRVLELVNG